MTEHRTYSSPRRAAGITVSGNRVKAPEADTPPAEPGLKGVRIAPPVVLPYLRFTDRRLFKQWEPKDDPAPLEPWR